MARFPFEAGGLFREVGFSTEVRGPRPDLPGLLIMVGYPSLVQLALRCASMRQLLSLASLFALVMDPDDVPAISLT